MIHCPKFARLALFILAGFGLLEAQNPAEKSTKTTNQATPPPTPAPRRGFAGAGGNYKEYSQEKLDNGKKTYSANCAFCHGGNAKGGETGPDLLRSVILLHDEDGVQLGQFIAVGRPEKGMPKFALPKNQVDDLAAFLHDRVRAAAERNTYQILDIVVGDPKAGEAYFNGAGKCASCHSVTGDLAHVGSKYDAVNLQGKIVMPREFRRGAGASTNKTGITATITTPDGVTVSGALGHIDDFSVTVLTGDGAVKTFPRDGDNPKVVLHDPLEAHTDLLSKYTDADIHNLTAYLLTFK